MTINGTTQKPTTHELVAAARTIIKAIAAEEEVRESLARAQAATVRAYEEYNRLSADASVQVTYEDLLKLFGDTTVWAR